MKTAISIPDDVFAEAEETAQRLGVSRSGLYTRAIAEFVERHRGLGVREAAYLVLFGFAGMSKVDAIALGLLWFASTMIGGLTGAIAFMTTVMPTLREAPATADTVESDPAN